MALENKPEALPLAKALWQAKDGLKKWEDQSIDSGRVARRNPASTSSARERRRCRS
jgi:hypothetical protein